MVARLGVKAAGCSHLGILFFFGGFSKGILKLGILKLGNCPSLNRVWAAV